MSRLDRLRRIARLRKATAEQALASLSERQRQHRSSLDLAGQLEHYREEQLTGPYQFQSVAQQENRLLFLEDLETAIGQQSARIDNDAEQLGQSLHAWQQARSAQESLDTLLTREQQRQEAITSKRQEQALAEQITIHSIGQPGSGTELAVLRHDDYSN